MDIPPETSRDLPSIAEILHLNQRSSNRWSRSYYADDKRPLSAEFFDSVRISQLYQSQSRNASTVHLDENPQPVRRCAFCQRLDLIRKRTTRWVSQAKCIVIRNLQPKGTPKDQSPLSTLMKVVQQPESDIEPFPTLPTSRTRVPCVRFSIPPPPPPKSSTRKVSSITVARARDAHVEKGRYIMSKTARNATDAVQERNSASSPRALGSAHDDHTRVPVTPVHIARCLKPLPEIVAKEGQ